MNSHHSELNSYRASVEELFENNSELIVTNRDKKHAAVLTSILFQNAKKEVVLFCQNLDEEFYDSAPIKSAVLCALERGVNVKILIQEEPQANELLSELKLLGSRAELELRKCDKDSEASKSNLNFAVIDQKAFRLESDRENNSAFACANNPKLANDMLQVFNRFREQSSDIK